MATQPTRVRPLQIRGWCEFYETAKSRTIRKLSWVPIPNAQDGMKLQRILSQPDGLAIFGVFVLMVELASRQEAPRQGWLTSNGREDGNPLSTEDIAFIFRRQAADIERALSVLTAPSCGWIVDHDQQQAAINQAHQGYREDSAVVEMEPAPAPKGKDDAGDEAVSGTRWIKDVWNENVPEGLARCSTWTSKRARSAVARLKDFPKREDWERAIRSIGESDFLMGRTPRSADHSDWKPDIDWILDRPNALAKLLEGAYSNKRRKSIGGEGELPF